MKILIADDDTELCALLKEFLEQEGMSVHVVPDGVAAIEILKSETFDLLVLDVMMPKLNGFDTLKAIKWLTSELAIIMLTAKGEKLDRIAGLEMGADDYIAKPCDPRELIARIRAVGKRTNQTQPVEDKLFIDDLAILKTSRQVKLSDKLLDFTSTEFNLLILLIEKAGELVSREMLSQHGLGKPLETFERSVDMHVSKLRKKLGPDEKGRRRIKTIRGIGYQYVVYPD